MSEEQNLLQNNNIGFGEKAELVDMAEFPSWIIYEDENFLALNKPGWLVCHPSKNGPLSSLAGAAREYLKADTIHIVNRLDRETSGVVILAKNSETASRVQKALQNKHNVEKTYLAVLEGRLAGETSISQPLTDDKESAVAIKTKAAPQKLSAKSAFTVYKPVAFSREAVPYTLAEVKIITGRKHQIRAHALWMNHPVVADKLYGRDEKYYLEFVFHGFTDEMAKVLPMRRQALHAFEVDFSKVFENMRFKAPLQADFLELLDRLEISLPEKYRI